ncbi:MAG: BatA domain-containing protein, partial [Caulobacteraceae bacterium]|nr:BatA domain-containing protein [Caulobacter sp.]
MLGLPLAFTAPAVLGALALLPVLYWLLRVTPPRPREIPFPPLRLILDQRPREETPSRTPPWLLLLRLAVAAAIILAMAGPIWNPPAALPGGTGPLVVLIDDGFAAA